MPQTGQRDYWRIVSHYEECFAVHGDSCLGVDWPRQDDAETRYDVMLGVIRPGHGVAASPASLLDFGCGVSHLYEHMRRRRVENVHYTGLDLSERFVAQSRFKFPTNPYYCIDVLEDTGPLPRFDYVVANGVFTEKRDLPYPTMLNYFHRLVPRLFELADVGIAFNVMSTHVDWERNDLFHLSMDALGRFLTRRITRHFLVRNDYGLYEYTVYAYREPTLWPKSSSSDCKTSPHLPTST